MTAIKQVLIRSIIFLCGFTFGFLNKQEAHSYGISLLFSSLNMKSHTKSSHVNIIDFNQTMNDSLFCMKTKSILIHFNTYICPYEKKRDIYVSGTFYMGQSIWEENTVTWLINLLIRHPNFDFIDIGANIGTYTMYAAALGRSVVSIDCFSPNIQRIHRAVRLASVENRVVLIENALYRKSGQYLELSHDSLNVGGQRLDITAKNRTNLHSKDTNNPFVVETIQFNDLLPIIKERGIRGALLKMDIEGSEAFVVESGDLIFDGIDIPLIIMEWVHTVEYHDRVEIILHFFRKRNYQARNLECKLLDYNEYKKWPNDIIWLKENRSNFC